MEDHLKSKPPTAVARCKFYNAVRGETETVAACVAQLQKFIKAL